MARLQTDTDGEYVVQLVVGNSRGQSPAQIVNIQVDSQQPKAASELTFVNDIKPLLQTQLFNLRTCQSCHSAAGISGIPVHYDDANTHLYRDVRARINFDDPENSKLVRKPTRHQHGGGIRFDRTTDLGKRSYSMLVDWILQGAPCGDDVSICHYK